MSDKKHIDRLFQEKLKDFEVSPSDAVWQNIEAKLNQKKIKKRVIPIWWRYAGVAAVLLLLLSIASIYTNSTEKIEPIKIVDIKTDVPTSPKTKTSHTQNKKATPIVMDNTIKKNTLHNSTPNTPKAVIATTAIETNNAGIKKKSTPNTNLPQKNTNKDNSLDLKNNTAIAKNLKVTPPANKLESVDPVATNNKKTTPYKSTNSNVIANVNDKDVQKNTVSKNLEDNSLTIEEAIRKNITKEKENLNLNRWRIAPNVAPVYFNTLGEGSPIASQFSSNSKTGEINMSYGISTSYAINKKLRIRSGINKVNLGYNTNNVVSFQSYGYSSSSTIDNVDTPQSSNNRDNVSVISKENLKEEAPKSIESPSGSLNQALGFIEVPFEFQYALSNNKLGINVIGGFSSFFLNNNKIYSETENGTKTYFGKANNINKISYSANFGLGLNYHISKKIDLNLEPMFKYQINTFNKSSGDFKPFFIGVYTGFAIKF